MLKIILAIIAVAIAAVLVYAATRPDTFRVERSVVITAPPDAIYPHLVDFRQWEAWSPWEKLDPAIRRDYSGAASGVGARYAWQGNDQVGQGRMSIVEAQPASRLLIDIEFTKPFAARNTVEFTLEPVAGGTRLTQAMYGPSPFISKLMGLFFDMDTMIGEKYEEGFAALKAQVEGGAPIAH